MLIGGDTSLFLESVSTGEQGHNAQWIANDLSRVIDDAVSKGLKVCGAVTDNTSTNKLAWKHLQAKYPKMFFQGCACHGLHLLIKVVFAATKAKRGRSVADYPDGYPFEYLLGFTKHCKDVVSFFSYHHQIKARLVAEQTAKKTQGLVQPAPTRWGSLKACFDSLLKSESILHGIVTSRDFIPENNRLKSSAQHVYDIVTDINFISNLQKSLAILEPIDNAIKCFEGDGVPVSEVYRCLKIHLKVTYESLDCLQERERQYLLQLLESRMEFLYGDAIGMAYVLDPRYLGDGMSAEERKKVEDCLFEFEPEQRELMFMEYTAYMIQASNERDEGDFRFIMLMKQSKTILQYWMIEGKQYPVLRSVALKVFGMVTSSASSERNFSTTGFIHSKLRNSLKPENVMKLVYIKTNAAQVGDGLLVYENSDSDDEQEMTVDEE
jgi:hypothetical protein